MHHSAKSFDIWITSLSHTVENFDNWSEILSCNLQSFVKSITLLYTVPKTLRCDLHICLTIQISSSGDLTFCTTKPKNLRGYHYFYLTMSTSLWGSLQIVSHCHNFEIRSTFLSRNVKIFVRWITSLSQSVKNFEVRIWSLSHSADVFEVWNTRLSSIVKILLSWLTIFYHSVEKKWVCN